MADTTDWKATMQLDGNEEELALSLPAWMDRDEAALEFQLEAYMVYDLDHPAIVLDLRAV